MLQSVQVENDVLKIEVWPRLGGKISSIIDKADGYELLFNYPAELPTACMYGQPYDATWYAGWDECLPAVGSGLYPGHPYDQIPIPDHGEIYTLPTTAVPTKDGITCVWQGLRFGYRLTRKIALTPGGLSARYTLVNLAPFDFKFVWAQHALKSLQSPVEIDLPIAAPWRWSHGVGGAEYQRPFIWPAMQGQGDFSRPSEKLPAGGGWKIFSADPIRTPAVIRYPDRQRRLEIWFRSETIRAHWGIWINTGGWNHQRQLAVEATTGRYDQLDRSVQDGSAAVVPAGATVEWETEWVVSPL